MASLHISEVDLTPINNQQNLLIFQNKIGGGVYNLQLISAILRKVVVYETMYILYLFMMSPKINVSTYVAII